MAAPPQSTIVPPVGPDPSIAPAEPAMTTIIENGRTVVLPIQQANTLLLEQSMDPGWGFTPIGATDVPSSQPPVPPVPTSIPPVVQPADPGTSLIPAPAISSIAEAPPPVIPVVSEMPLALTPSRNATPTSEPVVLPPPAVTSRPPAQSAPPTDDDIDPIVPVPHKASSTIKDVLLDPESATSTLTRPSRSPSRTDTVTQGRLVDSQPSRPAGAIDPASRTPIDVESSTSIVGDVVFDRTSNARLTSTTSANAGWNAPSMYQGTARITRLAPSASVASVSVSATNSQAQAGQGGLIAAQNPVSSYTDSAHPTIVPSVSPAKSLPAPGSPEESTVIALVSSSITITGSAAVAAIASGASQLDSKGQVIKSEQDRPALNSFAIAGIVAGSILLVIVLSAVWYSWRKKNQAKHDKDDPDIAEVARPDTGFDFTDDPVTASTGRMQRMTMHAADGHDPFHDRHRSQHGAQSWYQPEVDEMYDYSRQNNARHSQIEQHQSFQPDPLDQLYGDAIEEEQTRREMTNPFAPPVPPVPASMRQSAISRPATQFTDIYGAYECRPNTQVDTSAHMPYDEDDDRDLPAATPATSSLLPWLNKKKGNATPAPPVPALPVAVPPIPVHLPQSVGSKGLDRQYTTYESNAAGDGARKGGIQKPARPVMAQTPAGAGANEFNVMIPGFR